MDTNIYLFFIGCLQNERRFWAKARDEKLLRENSVLILYFEYVLYFEYYNFDLLMRLLNEHSHTQSPNTCQNV